MILFLRGEVAARRLGGLRRNANILDSDHLAAHAGNLDINAVCAKARLKLEEVVRLALRAPPGPTAVGRDLKLGHANVGVHDLHTEPPPASALLVLENDRGRDATGHKLPRHGDDAPVRVVKLGEGIGEEVQMVGAASGALVNDHGCDLVTPGTGYGNTGSAAVRASPVAVGEGGSIEIGGNGVAGEGAHATSHISAVEGCLTAESRDTHGGIRGG